MTELTDDITELMTGFLYPDVVNEWGISNSYRSGHSAAGCVVAISRARSKNKWKFAAILGESISGNMGAAF